MTVSTNQVRIAYVGDGSSVNFPIPFPFYLATDILVILSGATITSGYSIAGGGSGTPLVPSTGTVTMAMAPSSGLILQIVMNPPQTQIVNLVDGTAFPSATLDQINDRGVQISQRLQDQISRAIRTPDGDTSPSMLLPPAANRAGLGMVFDALGNLTLGAISAVVLTGANILGLIADSGYRYKIAPTESEAGLTSSQLTFGFDPGDIRRYGALSGTSFGSGGNGDCTAAILNASLGNIAAYIPPGDWRMDGQVTMNGTGLVMAAGAVITRYSAHSAATTPMFWYQGSYCSIVGPPSAQIVTQNKAPSGVVLNGCANMTSNSPLGMDMLYNMVWGIKLVGAVPFGQTSGAPDVCYMQINPQLDGKACYFAFLDDVSVNAANFGYWLQGDANGNLMSNLHGFWIGNITRATGQGADALLFSQGALDNSLSGLFHHFSPNIVSLRIEDYNNLATTNGSYHVTSYSQYSNFICEQGGTTTLGVVANANCSAFGNKIDVSDNVAGGNDISAYVLTNNQINLSSTGPSYPVAQVTQSLTVGNPNGGVLKGTLVSGSPTISNVTPPSIFGAGTTTDLKVGAYLNGTGIPTGTTVTAITVTATGAGTITMSANATSTVATAESIAYTSAPGTLAVGAGKVMQFVTPSITSGTATTVLPAGNITVDKAVMVLVSISNLDTNGGASRSDLLLLNPRNSGFSASTITVVGAANTASGNSSEPNSVAYALSFAAGAGLPALTANVTPLSGSHTYGVTCQLVSTG